MIASHTGSAAFAPVAALLMLLSVAGCGQEQAQPAGVARRTDAPRPASIQLPLLPELFPTPHPPPPPPLFDPNLPLTAPAVAVPLEFRLPAQAVATPIVAVGSGSRSFIDAPEGPAGDPVWTKAFLFRGGALPGAPGVTTIIGHVDDSLARPDPFAKVRQLHAGDLAEVVDQRSGEVIHYRITATRVVMNSGLRASDLYALFGTGAVTGKPADKAADAAPGIARLTLMTCTGQWRNGGFDRRFFAFGVRDETVSQAS